MSGELCSTEPAQQKLLAWLALTPRPWPASLDVEHVFTRIAYYGDDLIHHIVSRAIAGLPAVVADYLIGHVTFFGSGLQMLGWCGAQPSFEDRPFVVQVSAGDGTPEQIREIAVHECAHAWLMAAPSPGERCWTAFWQSTVLNTPVADVPEFARRAVSHQQADNRRHERLADALVRSWGFTNDFRRNEQ
ncbi:MAG: hypothetical protein ABI818_10300 [Acidobacteriota bacterium]